MKPDTFIRIANVGDLVGHGPFALSASGVDVALVRTGAGWRAFQGLCPHQGALLGEGEIEGDRPRLSQPSLAVSRSTPAGATVGRSVLPRVPPWNATGPFSSTSRP